MALGSRKFLNTHCVKTVQIRSFFWSLFSCIQSKYRKVWTRKNSVFEHFSRSDPYHSWALILNQTLHKYYWESNCEWNLRLLLVFLPVKVHLVILFEITRQNSPLQSDKWTHLYLSLTQTHLYLSHTSPRP